MPVTIQDKDLGFTRIELDLKHLRGRSVKVGIMGSESVDGVAVVDYAFYNEFGTSRGIPARPFMSRTYSEHKADMIKFTEFMYGQVIDGKMTPDHLLQTVGADYQSKIQKTIHDAKSWAAPNAPSTVAKKGSSSPLIDTGRMVGSVRYEVK